MRLLAFLAAAALSVTAALADQPGSSSAAKSNQCIGCHDIEGYKSVFPQVYPVPKIVNQNVAYIEYALKAYRSGERTHPSMSSIAAQLSDEDISQLAEFYAGGGGSE